MPFKRGFLKIKFVYRINPNRTQKFYHFLRKPKLFGQFAQKHSHGISRCHECQFNFVALVNHKLYSVIITYRICKRLCHILSTTETDIIKVVQLQIKKHHFACNRQLHPFIVGFYELSNFPTSSSNEL